eukprot:CAMPEP_0184857616 /NCGR_PEP_ID=MMETSP0580-20130426/2768_1 /TAXON_ID=1118495 /ORGANISM="Dactyliosolen fragilissimus" /LENGTH=296 /DNA_ID=CAMNT_0027353317 /DNA_START=121 /DNA_END=1008 /DNA_ORIENTATION=-
MTHSVIKLILLGVGMGFVHVLTGPDHLSALATLSANVGNFRAFWYGIRWGIGHSTGLVIVGIVMIALDNSDDDGKIDMPKTLSIVLESIVGIFMLLLGFYGLWKAYQNCNVMSVEDENKSNSDTSPGESTLELGKVKLTGNQKNDDENLPIRSGEVSMSLADITPSDESSGELGHYGHPHDHHHDHTCPSWVCFGLCSNPSGAFSKQVLALGIGLVHGIAGPGGVLGVIPAVQLHDWKLALIYLVVFCGTSTFVMGSFAALYGTCSAAVSDKNGKKMEFRMEIFSASLSIIVGIIW